MAGFNNALFASLGVSFRCLQPSQADIHFNNASVEAESCRDTQAATTTLLLIPAELAFLWLLR